MTTENNISDYTDHIHIIELTIRENNEYIKRILNVLELTVNRVKNLEQEVATLKGRMYW